MFSTGRLRLAVFVVCALLCAPFATAADAPATLYRVFLKDGSTLVSYGEYARVADRVVFSMPVGGTAAQPALQLLSIPASTVDWTKTDAYAESARASRYAVTSGPDDFAMLRVAVTNALTEIAGQADPQRKIAMAMEARQNVTKWVAEHYGYRAGDAAQMASLFDDVMSEARTAAGLPNFDLSLIANMAVPPSVPLLPAPSEEETIEGAVHAASLAPDAAGRVSLLHAIHDALAATPPEPWSAALAVRVDGQIASEERTTRNYAWLARRTLRAANRYATAANVRAITLLSAHAMRDDNLLGRKRPEEMASLLASLDAKLDAARRLRLARDQWAAREAVLAQYRRAIAAPIAAMRLSRDPIDQIRLLAGPSSAVLRALSARLGRALEELSSVKAPVEADTAHGLMTSAMQLAARAATLRRQAVAAGDMRQAWDAASAASGALMLFDRAAQELRQQATPPVLK